MPSSNNYEQTLINFMNWRDEPEENHRYNNDTEFEQHQLLGIQPFEIANWFKVKAYGKVDPGPDDHPTHCRSSSLEYWKKALSSFMPNRIPHWNVANNSGNPTKSTEVNDLIKIVKKSEVRKQGKPSQARRPMGEMEWRAMMEILMGKPEHDLLRKYLIPSFTKFQFHLIARIDDTAQALVSNLLPNANNDFTLKAKLSWSKNVQEERDAPEQVIIGSMDPSFCCLIGLAIWLETFISHGGVAMQTPYLFGINNDIAIPSGGDKVKNQIQKIFTDEIFSMPDFGGAGCLGSHSVRKFASTHCRKNGASKDEKDLRGRWKVCS